MRDCQRNSEGAPGCNNDLCFRVGSGQEQGEVEQDSIQQGLSPCSQGGRALADSHEERAAREAGNKVRMQMLHHGAVKGA
eukprot:1158368-Pelagomonas_calceolata.AAC.10